MRSRRRTRRRPVRKTTWRTERVLGRLLVCVGILTGPALGAMPDAPPSAIAWYHYDPSPPPGSVARPGADPVQRDLLLGAVRAGLTTGLFGDATSAHALQGLLAAAELGHAPHTVSLLEFRAHREPDGSGMDIDTLRCVITLELRGRASVAPLLRSIRALAVATSENDAGALEQSAIALPGGRPAVLLTSTKWPPWMALSWTTTDELFTLGIGRGALEASLAPAPGGADTPAWVDHRAKVTQFRPPTSTFLELYADIEALRRAFPAAFASGRTPRMLGTLDLGEARSAMLHARFVLPEAEAPASPPMIALDWTSWDDWGVAWSPLSASRWPGDAPVGMAPPPGSSVLVARIDWRELFDDALNIYEATVPDTELAGFRASRRRWMDRNGPGVDELLGSLRPWLVLSDVPTPILPIPGLATVFVGTRGGAEDGAPASVERLESIAAGLLDSFSDELFVSGAPGRRTWALKLDRRGVVRLPAWGFVDAGGGPLLVGGWGLPVVAENRSRLAPVSPGPGDAVGRPPDGVGDE